MDDAAFRGTISSLQFKAVISAMEKMAIPLAPILRLAGLDDAAFDSLFARFPVDVEHRFWAAIETYAGDPTIGVPGGVVFAQSGRHGADLYLALHSGTPRAAFRNAERFSRLTDDRGHVEVCEHGSEATVRVYRDGGYPRPAGAIDATFSSAYTLLRDRLSGFRATRLQFERPRPKSVKAYLDVYGIVPEFSADSNAVTFDRAWLDTPMRGSDTVLAEILLQQTARMLRELTGGDSLVARVQTTLADGLAAGNFSLERVARALGTSPRTLRRRLAELGVSFQGVLDGLRRELADEYLRGSDDSVAALAERLGFASTSAFQRAFQRWYGKPPSSYRRELRPTHPGARGEKELEPSDQRHAPF